MPLSIPELGNRRQKKAGLYLIGFQNEDATDFVKYGCSTNLYRRLNEYTPCSPFGFNIYGLLIVKKESLPTVKKERIRFIYNLEQEYRLYVLEYSSSEAKRLHGKKEILDKRQMDDDIIEIGQRALQRFADERKDIVESITTEFTAIPPDEFIVDQGITNKQYKKITGGYKIERSVNDALDDEVAKIEAAVVQKQVAESKKSREVPKRNKQKKGESLRQLEEATRKQQRKRKRDVEPVLV